MPGCIELDAYWLLVKWLCSCGAFGDDVYSMRFASLYVLWLLRSSPASCAALAARGAAGALYRCIEYEDFCVHSELLIKTASMFADAHPAGVLPVGERAASLSALLALAGDLVNGLESLNDPSTDDDDDDADADSDSDDNTDEDADEEDSPAVAAVKSDLVACLLAAARLLRHGPPLPRKTAGALLLQVLGRAAAQFACDAERHRAMRGALASTLASAVGACAVHSTDAEPHADAVAVTEADVEAMFENGLFDFAWRMLFRNLDLGHYKLASHQQPTPDALVAVMTRVAALPTATLERAFTPARVALAHAAPSRWRQLSDAARAALGAALVRFAAASPALAEQLLRSGALLAVLRRLEHNVLP